MKTRSVTSHFSNRHQRISFRAASKSRLLVVCILLITIENLLAQSELTSYVDMGKNNTMQDIFIRQAVVGEFKYLRNSVSAGFQMDLKNLNGSHFSGLTLNAGRSILIKPFPIEINGFFIETYFSRLLRQTDYGIFIRSDFKHFRATLGTSFKIYAFTQKAVIENGILLDASKMRENFNLIYSFSYFVRTKEKNWNAGISITDSDHFVVNQSTNPNAGLIALIKVNPSLTLNAQAWFKTAGLLNLHMNTFGLFFRAGISWNFN